MFIIEVILGRHMFIIIDHNQRFMFVIKVLPSPLVLENKAGYNALRLASHKDQFWLFFCLHIYTYNLAVTISRKFAKVDDLAILHSASNWQALEGTLTQDTATLSSYLYK